MTKVTGTIYEHKNTFLIISCSVPLRMKNIADKSCTEIEAHILYSTFFFRKLCHLWENVEKYGRPAEATDENMAYAHFTLGTLCPTKIHRPEIF